MLKYCPSLNLGIVYYILLLWKDVCPPWVDPSPTPIVSAFDNTKHSLSYYKLFHYGHYVWRSGVPGVQIFL